MEPGLRLPLSTILSIVLLICFSKIQLSTCLDADILEPPTNQTVPISQSEARFSCKAIASAVFWLVNDDIVSTSMKPSWINIYPDIHDFSIPTVTREIGVLTAGHNNTKIVCHATGSSQTTETSTSAPAWLVIVDVPESPSPQLAVINSTTISVTWNKPFSSPGFDILRYTLNVHNGTSPVSAIITTKVFDASGIDNYPVQYFYTSPNIFHSECHNISIEVTSSNSAGISEAGVAVGGFPIAPREFSSPPVTAVTFTTELLPIVSVTFELPMICWFQTGTYSIQIVNSQTMQQAVPTIQDTFPGSTNPTILTAMFEVGFETDRFYDAIVTAETLAGSSNVSARFNTSFNVSPQDVPHLTIVNSTAIEVSWNRSSTFPQDVAISYTVVVRNETEKLELLKEVFNVTAGFNSYPMNYTLTIEDTVFDECHNISFTILAINSEGKSERPGSAISGFPIAPAEFTNKPIAAVSFSPNLEPTVQISFEYPQVCWFQSMSYRIQIFDTVTERVVEERGPLITGDSSVTEEFSGLEYRYYVARVYADTFAGSVDSTVDFNTTINFPPTTTEAITTGSEVPSTGSTDGVETQREPNMGIVIGASVAGLAVLLLFLLCVCTIIICLWRARKRKIKAQRRRRPPMPLVDNPLYEAGGPIYEEIPGECKGFASIPRKSQSQGSEYVMIEGMTNGHLKHYDQIGSKSEDCKILKDNTPSKADLGISLPTDYIFPISGPTLTPGEDAYTLMNPAGTLTSSMEQNRHCASSKSTENLPLDGIPSHVRIRPSYSLPLEGIAGNISGDNGTPEERYVRHSLLT